METEIPNLGKCCMCEVEGPQVRNIVMLDMRSPEPGVGCWGCLECGLELAGAITVLCDECAERIFPPRNEKPTFAVLGIPALNRRIPLATLTEPFAHDMSKHQGEAFVGMMPIGPEAIADAQEYLADAVRRSRHAHADHRTKANSRNGSDRQRPSHRRNTQS